MSAIAFNTKPYHRIKYYTDFINDTAKQIDFQEKIHLRINEIFSEGSKAYPLLKENGFELKNVIKVNLSMLIKAKDVPKPLIIKSLNDPKILKEKFSRDVIRWINGYFQTQPLTYPLSTEQQENVTMLLFRASQPELLEKARKWEIVHEMGHLIHRHIEISKKVKNLYFTKMIQLGIGGFSILSLSFLTGFSPILFNPMIAGTCISLIAYNMYVSDRDDCRMSREQEYEADEFGVQKLKDKSGALWYFQTQLSWDLKFAPADVDREFPTHPSHNERFVRIRQLQLIED